MYHIPAIILFIMFIPMFLAGVPLEAWAEVHHDLRITLDPRTSTLEGVDTITASLERGPLNLLLSQRAVIEDVRVEDLPSLNYTFQNGRLSIFLPTTGAGKISVRIAYRAFFDDPVPENPAHDEDPSYGVTAVIAERGTFLGAGAYWYPVLPGSPASFRLRVEGPPGMEAVTAGRLVERVQTEDAAFSLWESKTPLDVLTLAAGPYRVEGGEAAATQVYTFLYPSNAHLADTYLEATAGYLDLFRGLFGPYPFPKFAVAENFFPTGYGFPSWTLLGSTVVRLPFIVETSLGHEIAHSWWGNGVEVDYSRGNWSEGLTTYVADHLFKERKSDEEGREYRLKILRDYTALVSPDESYPLSRFTSRRSAADQAIGYGKSAMVFHMVRQRLGEEAFWEGLRSLAQSHLHREASWSDFASTWRRISGVDLQAFFRQWVERPGAPLLELRDVSAEKVDAGWRVRGRLHQQKPYYELRVTLRIETAAGPVDRQVSLTRGGTDFEFLLTAAPLRLIADPDIDLFRRLHPEEMPPIVNSIKGSENLLAVVADDLPEGVLESARPLLAALRHPGAPLVREGEVDPADLAGHDLLYLGLPSDPSLRPPVPPGLGISGRGFTVDGTSYGEEGSALFAVLPHPVDANRSAALYLPLSAAAARAALRKIPHYGKYSYLAFVAGENRAKGIWPVTSSPLIHAFTSEVQQ